jgi:hypothetical protein
MSAGVKVLNLYIMFRFHIYPWKTLINSLQRNPSSQGVNLLIYYSPRSIEACRRQGILPTELIQ